MKPDSSSPAESPPPLPVADLYGMTFARVGTRGLLDHMFGTLARGQGGWLVTANLDFLRRHVHEPAMRTLYGAADVRVADGMPLVWAARLAGDPLPERVAGSALIFDIAARAAAEGRSLYLLGGADGASARAAAVLAARLPSVKVVGAESPWVSSPPAEDEIRGIAARLRAAAPDILFVGLGSPKQEQLIQAIRAELPKTWMVGVGMGIGFLAGDLTRAPTWMQKTGLEWTFRLAQEPRRLGRRYLVDGLPFSVSLFAHALGRRARAAAKSILG